MQKSLKESEIKFSLICLPTGQVGSLTVNKNPASAGRIIIIVFV